MLNEIKGSISMNKVQWKLNLVKMLTIVSAINLIVWCLLTETVYIASAEAVGLEGDNFKTYIIISMFLSGVAVVVIYFLATLFFGDILDLRSSWAFLLSGIIVVATAHLHGLMTIISIVLGMFFIVAGICILCCKGA